MKQILLICVALHVCSVTAQDYLVQGVLLDAIAEEPISDAAILINDSIVDYTNYSGVFKFMLERGSYELNIRHIAFIPHKQEAWVSRDTHLVIRLEHIQLPEVHVGAPRSLLANVAIEKILDLDSRPTILGESDPIKALTHLPGIQQGLEGFSGIVVRGGETSQNLILFEDLELYHKGHLLGFMSTLNQDMIESVSVYKNYFPPEYGGRLSSIIHANTKNEITDTMVTKFSLGLLNSGIYKQIPIQKNKSMLEIAGRTSYAGIALKPYLKTSDQNGSTSTELYFFEFMGKYHHKLSEDSKLEAVFNYALDIYDQTTLYRSTLPTLPADVSARGVKIPSGGFSIIYENTISAKTKFRNAIFFNNVNNKYYNEAISGNLGTGTITSVRDAKKVSTLGHKSKLSTQLGTVSLDFSMQNEISNISPQLISGFIDDAGERILIGNDKTELISENHAISWEGRKKMGTSEIYGGTRAVYYQYDLFNAFYLEPRIGIELGSKRKLGFWYVENHQFLHSISSLASLMPIDFLLPSNEHQQPQMMRQMSLGYGSLIEEWSGGASVQVTAYSKFYSNLSQIYPGKDVLFNTETPWTSFLVSGGKGSVVGLELAFQQRLGQSDFQLNYTYTNSSRKFSLVNRGSTFSSNFERPHFVNADLTSPLGEKWKLSLSAQCGSGIPVTIPSALKKEISGIYVPVFLDKNNYRMKPYHKLDIQLRRTWFGYRKHGMKTLTLGVYNAYGRKNLISLFYERTSNRDGLPRAIFGGYSFFRFVPILNYKMEW